ncbi:MAG: antirestriction protein ArdA [Gemmatimonadota bacterium]|nr:MAG: antirestriction protein ArdA [Gemmatimonadota bacterium]
MTTFYAQSYSGSGGFQFDSAEEYHDKYAVWVDRGVEEFEIQVLDGDHGETDLADALLKRGSFNVDSWYDSVEGLADYEKAALFWWVDYSGGDDLDEGLAKVDCCLRVMEGTIEDYAHELIDDLGVENINNPDFYFDFEAFGRDLGFDLDPDDPDDEYYLSMSDRERGEEYVDSMGGVGELGKELAARYFDYAALARDLELGGDAVPFVFAGSDWVMTTPHEA